MRRFDLPILAIFALGPIQWVTLLDVGLALKPVHLILFAVAAYGWSLVPRHMALLSDGTRMRGAPLFLAGFAAYLAALASSILWSGPTVEGLSVLAKHSLYSLSAFGVSIYVATRDRETLLRTLCLAPLVSAGIFVAVATVVLQSRGISLFSLVGTAIATANPTLLQFSVFLNLFNSAADLQSGDRSGPALRHTALSFIWLSAIAAGAVVASGAKPGRLLSLATWVGIGLAVVVVALSLSRSLILAFAIAACVIAASRALSGVRPTLLGILTGTAVVVLSILVLALATNLTSLFGQRLGAFENDGRLAMYGVTWEMIAEAPFTGHGIGSRVVTGARDHQVHNLFLAAWLQAGLLALIAAATYIAGLVILAASAVLNSRASALIGCLAASLALPLLRSQISGESGNFTIGEWLCIGIFAGTALRFLQRPATMRGIVQPRWSLPGRGSGTTDNPHASP